MIRFLQFFDNGRGDYSKERHASLDHLTVGEIVRAIRERESREKRQD